jgi:hypothetical protein
VPASLAKTKTVMFRISDRNLQRSKYLAENEPLELILIHDPKKKSPYQFNNVMNLVAALFTFRCVITNTSDVYYNDLPVAASASTSRPQTQFQVGQQAPRNSLEEDTTPFYEGASALAPSGPRYASIGGSPDEGVPQAGYLNMGVDYSSPAMGEPTGRVAPAPRAQTREHSPPISFRQPGNLQRPAAINTQQNFSRPAPNVRFAAQHFAPPQEHFSPQPHPQQFRATPQDYGPSPDLEFIPPVDDY